MISRVFIFAALLVLIQGCASQQRLNTQSGGPEAMFYGKTTEAVLGEIAGGCTANGLTIFDMGANQVVAGKQMTGGEAIAAKFMIGNAYSTPPMRKIRFVAFPVGVGVKVSANEWIETQSAYGQTRQVPMTSTKQMQSTQQFLRSLGGT